MGWSDGIEPAPAIVAIVVIPTVVTRSETAVPAIVVVVGTWSAMVDASVARTRAVAGTIAAITWTVAVVTWSISAVAWTVAVIAWTISAAVVAAMVAVTWVYSTIVIATAGLAGFVSTGLITTGTVIIASTGGAVSDRTVYITVVNFGTTIIGFGIGIAVDSAGLVSAGIYTAGTVAAAVATIVACTVVASNAGTIVIATWTHVAASAAVNSCRCGTAVNAWRC